jgi:hypothetical protein
MAREEKKGRHEGVRKELESLYYIQMAERHNELTTSTDAEVRAWMGAKNNGVQFFACDRF